jgi:predicted alpha/beta superfamily hydrolase
LDYQGGKKDLFIYIDNGGVGLETELQPGIDEMLAVLDHCGYQSERDYICVQAPDAEHNESAWAKRFPNALKLCLQH